MKRQSTESQADERRLFEMLANPQVQSTLRKQKSLLLSVEGHKAAQAQQEQPAVKKPKTKLVNPLQLDLVFKANDTSPSIKDSSQRLLPELSTLRVS